MPPRRSINPNRIADLRVAAGLNQKELAGLMHIHWVTLSKIERGEMRLTQAYMESIARMLNVGPEELLFDNPSLRPINIDGIICMNRVSMLEEEKKMSLQFQIGVKHPDVSFYFISQDYLFDRVAGPGDLLRFTNSPNFSTTKMLDRICLLEDYDGAMHVGWLKLGSNYEIYNIQYPSGEIIKDLRPRMIALLTMVLASQALAHARK